ncbi:hypothetical protein D3C72_1104120 [compost metagenome]
MSVHLGHHGLGQRSSIEGVCPFVGQGLQYLGQRRVGELGARHLGGAVRLVEVGAGLGIPGEVGVFGNQGSEARAYHKTLFRQRDGGLEQAGPGQLAIAMMGHRQGAYRAGGANRAASHHAVVEGHGFAILHEQLIRGGCWRRLPTIHRRHLAPIPHQQQGSAADAR